LAEVAAGVVDDLAPSAEAAQVALTTELTPTPTLGNTALVDRLVANLVDNAIRHNEPGGWVEVATASDGAAAGITVRNHSPTEPAEPVDELFQPFRRGAVPPGRTPSAGHGLGLSIVRAIAAGHGAELHAERDPTGDVFQVAVRFPNPPPAPGDSGHPS
ncbi:MAG: ATP-binding protein, partial [Actinomycetota bacterium]